MTLLGVGKSEHRGWTWWGAWLVCGATISMAVITGLSVGLLILPIGLLLSIAVMGAAPHLAEATGLIAGAGTALLVVASINLGSESCPSSGSGSLPAPPRGGSAVSGAVSSVCGGLDPVPWAVTGCILVAVSAGAFLVVSHRFSRG